MDQNPDEDGFWTIRDENTSEKNRIDKGDIYSANQKKTLSSETSKKAQRKFKYLEKKYRLYWDDKPNDFKATKTYAKYFNADNHIHYINGSHGLESNGAHRVDHGIALGYKWAMTNWGIIEKKKVDERKENEPQIESKATHYKPVTIIGHSQGACMAAGVKLGIIKYAKEKGWNKVAINSIFLGSHQPRGLFGQEYQKLVNIKKNQYFVNQNALSFDKNEKGSLKFLSRLSQLYDEEHLKVYNERGLFEHVKYLCTDWEAYKSRAIQFAFANDRGDLVTLDGDIPEIKSACSKKPNTSLFSTQYFHTEKEIPKNLKENKIDLSKYNGKGGFVCIPKYIASERYNFEKIKEGENLTEEEKKFGLHWNNYESVAISWGNAMYNFIQAKIDYETVAKENYIPKIFGLVIGGSKKKDNLKKRILKKQLKLKTLRGENINNKKRWLRKIAKLYYKIMLLHYSALQNADLYAHFAPVAFITHKKILKDNSGIFDDQYGNESIFDRIIKAGDDRFYRIEYKINPNQELTEEQKRAQEKEYLEDEGKKHLIDTDIFNEDYINYVIKSYVKGETKYERKLYKENKPNHKH